MTPVPVSLSFTLFRLFPLPIGAALLVCINTPCAIFTIVKLVIVPVVLVVIALALIPIMVMTVIMILCDCASWN